MTAEEGARTTPKSVVVDATVVKIEKRDADDDDDDNANADAVEDDGVDDARDATSTCDDAERNKENNEEQQRQKTPRIRLKPNLATDPALQASHVQVKTELETTLNNNRTTPTIINNNNNNSEYLSALPVAIQSALARSYYLPLGLSDNNRADVQPQQQQPPPPPPPPTAPLYVCNPCSIRFSSLSTLEAHQTYYCSHRTNNNNNNSKDADDAKSLSGTDPSGSQSDHDGADSSMVVTKAAKTGKQYACTHCTYSADKKVSLNRHMRMHTVSPTVSPSVTATSSMSAIASTAAVASNGDLLLAESDRYCTECDIRFSSQKTYRAHKMHYCSSRHMVKQQQAVVPPPPPPIAVIVNNASGNKTGGGSCTSESMPASPVDGVVVACRSPQSPASNGANNNSNNNSTNAANTTPMAAVSTATASSSSSSASSSSVPQHSFMALPTNPIIILPYSLVRGASFFSGILPHVGAANANGPCFLLPNGTIQPMSQALSTPTTVTQTDVLKTSNKPKEVANPRDSSTSSSASAFAPLDLSIRKSPSSYATIGDHEKENLKRKSPSPERIECVPSLHGSPPLTPSSSSRTGISPISMSSASPKRKYEDSRSNSPRQTRVTPKSVASDTTTEASVDAASTIAFGFPVVHPFLRGAPTLIPPDLQLRLAGDLPPAVAAAAAAAAAAASVVPPTIPVTAPQVLVKQGVSKCKECNIVFCKHENYLIHKKHYCSARLQDDDAAKSTSPPAASSTAIGASSGSSNATPPAAGQYQQLICLACGIKFASLDNLNAHQSYYCLKRNEVEAARRCGKCRAIIEPGHHQCGGSQATGTTPSAASSTTTTTGGGASVWKCPCCDVVSHTASAAQRHMETHSGVKAYRCKICRYKGNTLRGMRTHIRMHFDKRSPDLQEEQYISYILEDDGLNNQLESGNASVQTSVIVEESAVSPTPSTTEPSPSSVVVVAKNLRNKAPETTNGIDDNNKRHHHHHHHQQRLSPATIALISTNYVDKNDLDDGDDEEIVVKKEAIEPEVIIAQIDEPIVSKDAEQQQQFDSRTNHAIIVNNNNTSSSSSSSSSSTGDRTEADILQEAAKPGPKYCKSCDISFTYFSTFVAHKKFYCSSHTGEITSAASQNNNNNNNSGTTAGGGAATPLSTTATTKAAAETSVL